MFMLLLTDEHQASLSNTLRVDHTSTCPMEFVDYNYIALMQLPSFMFISKVGINVILNCRSCSSGRSAVPVPAKSHVAQLEINTRG